MSERQTVTDRAVTLGYKLQRKLRRELRKHFTLALVRKDLGEMRRATRGREARDLVLGYAELNSLSWMQDPSRWLDAVEQAAVIAKANEAVAHRFDLLGSGLVDAGDPIDWHRDLKTGFRWPERTHHLRIAWDAVPLGTDIKMPWELSRCQHFAALGLAYGITNDDHYYQEFKTQIRHWIQNNPCGFGVNWVCAMDVAIRAVNWLAAVVLFRDRIAEDDDSQFFEEMVEALWLHGCHIMRNLEWQGPRSASLANHFLADICGLLAVGSLFRHSAHGKRWLDFSHRWFETEIRRQVFSDGANFETSTSYHRLSHEMFLWADTLARRLEQSFSDIYRERLSAMAGFVDAYTSPSGIAAQFGDNDGGRLLMAGIDDACDHRYLTTEECGFGGRANRLLLRGNRELPPTKASDAFPKAGYWFGAAADAWLGVRAGVLSHAGAHAHADQLSFVLSVAGRDVIVDPGTGVYSADPEKRNKYRATAAHNAPQLNGLEANCFACGMAGLFRMTDDTLTEIDTWEVTPERVSFEGRHHGFTRERENCECARSLRLERGKLTVIDRISQLREGDRIEWTFCLAPGVIAQPAPDGAILIPDGLKIQLSSDPVLKCEIVEATFSPSYGVEIPTFALRLRQQVIVPISMHQRIELRWNAI